MSSRLQRAGMFGKRFWYAVCAGGNVYPDCISPSRALAIQRWETKYAERVGEWKNARRRGYSCRKIAVQFVNKEASIER